MLRKTIIAALFTVAFISPDYVNAQVLELPNDPFYEVPQADPVGPVVTRIPLDRKLVPVPVGPVLERLPLDPKVVAVPEPGTWLMLASGLLGVVVVARRREGIESA